MKHGRRTSVGCDTVTRLLLTGGAPQAFPRAAAALACAARSCADTRAMRRIRSTLSSSADVASRSQPLSDEGQYSTLDSLSTLQLMIKIACQSFISHSANPPKLPFPPDRRHLADACAYARMRNAHASPVLGPGLGRAQAWRVSGG